MPYHVDGCQAMRLDGHIFLCGRNDGHPERHYKGKLTHLSLFDAPLSPANIAALYVSVKGEKVTFFFLLLLLLLSSFFVLVLY